MQSDKGTQLGLPQRVAVDVESRQPVLRKESVNGLAVRHGTRRGRVVVIVPAFLSVDGDASAPKLAAR